MIAFAALLLAFSGPHDVEGVWATGNGRAHVEISETADGSIRGEIIWYASYGTPEDDGGILGMTLLEDFERADDRWRRGTIINLKNGRAYKSTLERVDEDTLAVEGCLSLFCRTQSWKRVAPEDIQRLSPAD
ncbi:MAG: DUF2147 domain-containing protein [Parvularculaceae bacterium]|nr:DUF2147 domain-containing protein [Parvularculaceae bacterium]